MPGQNRVLVGWDYATERGWELQREAVVLSGELTKVKGQGPETGVFREDSEWGWAVRVSNFRSYCRVREEN